mmetsp:Transcript_24362/g.44030  ORF Transcript_24362/g.44030 Transcript_24362/m.44030 type:complete len:204 (-) Transcript_24362:3815-4426(-)
MVVPFLPEVVYDKVLPSNLLPIEIVLRLDADTVNPGDIHFEDDVLVVNQRSGGSTRGLAPAPVPSAGVGNLDHCGLPTTIGDVAPERNVQDLTLHGLLGEEVNEVVVGHLRPGQGDPDVLVRREAGIELKNVLHLQMGGSAEMRHVRSHGGGWSPCRVEPQPQGIGVVKEDVREVAHLGARVHDNFIQHGVLDQHLHPVLAGP